MGMRQLDPAPLPNPCPERLLHVPKTEPGAAGGSGRPSLSGTLLTTLAAGSGHRWGPVCSSGSLSLPGTRWGWDLDRMRWSWEHRLAG